MFQVSWLRQPALKSGKVQQQPSCFATSNFLHCPPFCMLQSHPEDLLTVFSKRKFPSRMNFWNHVYSVTVAAFSCLFQPLPPSHSGATSPLFSGLPTTFLPGFMICAILLPGPFFTSNVVPNRVDRLPGLPPQCHSHRQQCKKVSWAWPQFPCHLVGCGAPDDCGCLFTPSL